MSNESGEANMSRPLLRAVRPLAMLIAIGLLVAAAVAVWQQRDTITDALSAVRRPDPLALTILMASVLASIFLSGVMFQLLMSRYGRIGFLEMQAIVAGTILLNYLPLRPGLVSRIAYHRIVHRIRAIDTTKVAVQAALITALIALYLALASYVTVRSAIPLWLGALGPIVVVLIGLITPWRLGFAAVGVRYVEVLIWVARYHAAFALIDSPITLNIAIAFACISVITGMVPLVSNGLGLREWAVGLVAPLLTTYHLERALTAELVNRAAEIIVVAIVGGAALVYLTRRRAAHAMHTTNHAMKNCESYSTPNSVENAKQRTSE